MPKDIHSPLSETGFETHRVGDAPLTEFAVMGERCSGTNIARWMVSHNLGLRFRPFLGWKHGFPQTNGVSHDRLVVCVFRDPLAWLASLHRKPFHTVPAMRDLSLSDFIRHRWETRLDRPKHLGVKKDLPGIKNGVLQQDRHPLTGLYFDNACALRTAKASALLGFRHRGVNLCLLRMETLLDDPATCLRAIADQYDLPFDGEVKTSDANMGSGSFESDGKKPRDTFSDADLEFLRSALDPDLERDLGYSELF